MLSLVIGLVLFQGVVGVPSMIGLLIGLLVLLVVIYIVYWLVGQIQMSPPMRNIITAILALLFLYILLHNFLGII